MSSTQTDVLASKPVTGNGQLKSQNDGDIGRARIKAVYGISNTAGSVVFYDGTDNTGPVLMTVNTPAKADSGIFWFPVPGQGVLAEEGIYVTVSGAASVMIFYG